MKLKKFKCEKKKYFISAILVCTLFLILLGINGSLAKYRTTQSINIVKGTINYSPADLSLMAIFIEGDNGYESVDSIPESGYQLNSEESYCKVGDIKQDVTISYDVATQTLTIMPMTQKGMKCFLYFDEEVSASSVILANKTVSERTDFSTTLTEDTTGTIYIAEDDDGTSYYYAGAATDNYVKFGQFQKDVYYGYYSTSTASSYKIYDSLEDCNNASSYNINCSIGIESGDSIYWRIIRINGDGTIRLIYIGENILEKNTTQITTSAFNSSYKDNAYVGYMYTSGSAHGYVTSSVIKEVLDNWYSSNLLKYSDYISYDTGFCGDRDAYTNTAGTTSGGGTGTEETYYGAYVRLVTNKTPSFKCSENSDLYTISSSTKGNKALTYPIGLITADEVAYAGGVSDSSKANAKYYLHNASGIHTMTPAKFSNNFAYMFSIATNGSIITGMPYTAITVRPVINLRADIELSGSGTTTDPYIVVGAE